MSRIGVAHTVRAEIAATTSRFLAAVVSGDGASAAAVYGEDALLLPPTGGVISGRDAIERFWRSGIEIGLRSVELEALGHGGTGTVLYEHGRYQMLLAPGRGRSTVERGAYLAVHVQDDHSSWHWAVTAFGTAEAKHQTIGNE